MAVRSSWTNGGILSLILLAVLPFAGCGPFDAAAPDQADLCQVEDWTPQAPIVSGCRKGQKIAFFPRTWGNHQLPILFAAANCDLRFAVALTDAAATCIYLGIDSVGGEPIERPAPSTPEPKATPKSEPSKSGG